MKGDKYKENREARNILCKFGINPYCGCANLIVARNWCHSEKYAQRVLALLQGVTSKAQARQRLKTAAEEFARCNFDTPEKNEEAKKLEVPDVTIDELN